MENFAKNKRAEGMKLTISIEMRIQEVLANNPLCQVIRETPELASWINTPLPHYF